jgi:hypothetical protein
MGRFMTRRVLAWWSTTVAVEAGLLSLLIWAVRKVGVDPRREESQWGSQMIAVGE